MTVGELRLYNNLEFADLSNIALVQKQLLERHIDYCLNNSPFYKKNIKDGTDFSQLPFTEKSHLEEFNDDFLAVAPNKIVDIVMSSGTTGKATKIMYTENDLARLAYNERISFEGCGITDEDVVLLTCTIDRCFIAGLAYFSGLRALGAATIRNGHGTMTSHLQVIKSHKPTVIVGVPAFVRKLAHFLTLNGVEPYSSSVKKIICIGEPLRDQDMNMLKVALDLENLWGAKVFSTYASSETITTFCECTQQMGGHLHPDLAVLEIVDEHGNNVGPGRTGEVVLTPLQIEGMPLLRFKTGDISFIIEEKCACGRSSIRLGPVLGRKKQMLKIKGTTVYPQAVFSAVSEIDGIEDYYIEVRSEDLSDRISVYVSLTGAGEFSVDSVSEYLQSRLRVRPDLYIEDRIKLREKVYSPESRKPIRFFDKR